MTVFAVVPVKDLAGTKSRLAPMLDGPARAGLTIYMMQNVLSAVRGAGVERALVVSPDPTVLRLAAEAGAETLRQESSGLNEALEEARGWVSARGASAMLVLPADLAMLRAPDVGALLEEATEEEQPAVVVSPDVAEGGTNALLLRPPDAVPFLFGPGSFDAHREAAREGGARVRVLRRPALAFDLDTAEDLRRLGVHGEPGPRVGPAQRDEGLRVLPVRGMGEVGPGDDLPAAILGAAGSSPGLRDGDVLVVTHKIVSKAEGRLVDLRAVEPSTLAESFASRYGKDARQVEVVLRESKRIVRMDRGVIISETHHGLVCANAGVDASNVAGEDSVCLLPLDPDASARRLRERLLSRLGLPDLAVIVSDSFGRPWREGITNVAIGVAGMSPLADYRGGHDPYGNPLQASVLAVADELASAAELVMGKTQGVPVAVVRGYRYRAGDGSGRDLLMDPARDLFR
jgi:coenzyme F420-0:L-glutamate ligase/coenzyme F420-1:gamma-L-glutamate ligase